MAASKNSRTTRKTRAANGKKTSNKKVIAAVLPIEPKKLPSVIALSRQSLQIIWRHKRLFIGLIALYALLSLILVGGLGAGTDVAGIRNAVSNRFVGSLAAYSQLLISATGTPSQAGSVYQLVLYIIFSLALIWSLRQLYANQTIRVRDAYYKAMTPLIPYILVLLWIGLQLIPMLIGTGLYQVVVGTGIARSAVEVIVWLVLAIGLTLVSAYLVVSSIMALIIVTLPDMAPRAAIKLAAKLVKSRRWTILRKLLFLPVVLILITAVILVPVILVLPPAASVVLLLLGPILVAIAHSYVYALYRELMDD